MPNNSFSTFTPPSIPKPKPIGVGDAKQLSGSFTRQPVPTAGVDTYTQRATPGQTASFYKPPAQKPTQGQNPNQPGGPAATTATQSIYDLSTDPVIQKIRAVNTAGYGTAVAGADAARKQALIDAGFGDIAGAAQFGSLENPTTGDQATVLAARANPFSVAHLLALAHAAGQQQIGQNDNAQNLLFSSTHGHNLGTEATDYLGRVSGAQGALRSQLEQILSGLVGTRTSEQQAEADALSTARQNAVANAIATGQTFSGYDANGNPIFKTPGGNSGVDTTTVNNDAGRTAAGTGGFARPTDLAQLAPVLAALAKPSGRKVPLYLGAGG